MRFGERANTREPPGRALNVLAVYAVAEIEKIVRCVTVGVRL
jgi:uncharacterized small protein (DUF1192 family)